MLYRSSQRSFFPDCWRLLKPPSQLGTITIMLWSSASTHDLYTLQCVSSRFCSTWKKCMLTKAIIDKQLGHISDTWRWMKQRNRPTAGSIACLPESSSRLQWSVILWTCTGIWYPEDSVQIWWVWRTRCWQSMWVPVNLGSSSVVSWCVELTNSMFREPLL